MLARPPRAPELLGDRPRGLGEVDGPFHDRQLARIEAGEVEQIGREPRQPGHLRAHLLQELAARRRSSRSSSAISSRKPPSEKSGVRSSCEALAMNSRRARSRSASRSRIVVERARELADFVPHRSTHRLLEVTCSDAPCRGFEPAEAPREAAGRQRAGERGDAQRDEARDEQAPPDQADVGERVLERRGEQDDVALVARDAPPRRTSWPSRSTRPDTARPVARPARDRVAATSPPTSLESREDESCRFWSTTTRAFSSRTTSARSLGSPKPGAGLSRTVETPGVARARARPPWPPQPRLEPRHDHQVDDPERPDDHAEEDERELEAERQRGSAARIRRPGSDTRRRAP